MHILENKKILGKTEIRIKFQKPEKTCQRKEAKESNGGLEAWLKW
jgi:hypothetical protein